LGLGVTLALFVPYLPHGEQLFESRGGGDEVLVDATLSDHPEQALERKNQPEILIKRSLTSRAENKERRGDLSGDISGLLEWRKPKQASSSRIAIKLNQERFLSQLCTGQSKSGSDSGLPNSAFPNEEKNSLLEER